MEIAIEFFAKNAVHTVLVLGSGCGRNAEALAKAGFGVSGLEISETAYNLAVSSSDEMGLGIDYKLGDVFELPLENNVFDGVYCFNTLHLFSKKKRVKLIDKVYRTLKQVGILVFTVFSEKESSFGQEEELESNTFESKQGRPVRYFTENDLNEYFKRFTILDHRIIEESENHGVRPHTHILRLILAKKE